MRLGCRLRRARLVDLADGRLTPVERMRLERHVAGCEGCAAALDALRGMPGRLRAALPDAHDDAFWRGQREAVMRSVRAAAADPVPAPAPRFAWGSLAAGLAVVAIALVLVRGRARDDAAPAPDAGVPTQVDALDDDDLATLADVTGTPAPEGIVAEATDDARDLHALDDDDLDALGDLLGNGAT